VGRTDLAERLEVTPRTVERDILALQQAGVPIWPLNFDATEALAVIAALTAARSMPFAEAGRRAEQKILAAMSVSEAARARELAGRLRVGSFGGGGAHAIVAATERAVLGRSVVHLEYRDRQGRWTSRTVEAHGLHVSEAGAYLLGWCRTRDAERAFRLDRIASILDTGEPAPERRLDGMVGWEDDIVTPGLDGGGAMSTTPAKRRGGPPRKVDHRTGSSPDFARAVAETLPRTERATRRGTTTCSVDDVPFLTIDDADGSAVVQLPDRPRTLLLATLGRDEVREAIEQAWAAVAPKAAVTAQRRKATARSKLAALRPDDVRAMVAALPGANEGPIWGTQLGFRATDEKKTRFARFGPPEGDRIGNLLPPDDEDALVIFHCEQKAELLASSADRFFTTPHYGPIDEPGGIILRLAEQRGDAEHAEIAELLEDAWREVAPPDRIEEIDRRRGS
jgi:hypothetical protein